MKKLILILGLCISGCYAYLPPHVERIGIRSEASELEVAAIAFAYPSSDENGNVYATVNSGSTQVIEVDGKPVSISSPISAIYVSPGAHTLKVRYAKISDMKYTGFQFVWTQNDATINLQVDVVAGHRYYVESISKEGKIKMRLIDKGNSYPISCLTSQRWDLRRSDAEKFSIGC